ncbi:ABC-2 type transport system permease protein [Nonomuraea polychroma]|uniref:Transport permease protein n=1 Tax=Nonomuraea polychroma TaxID=46176 RepID=A0A438MJ78_9ACTN|nr:ABC transporter permease [Nonomuraea polychroma]RVX45962.1 ABC-2 type transport system permease protein [Nonomuraea polychroma]
MRKILIVEAKLHLRDWPYMLFTIGLPVGLLVVLGLTIPTMSKIGAGGLRAVDTQLPSMMTLLSLLVLACNVVPAVLSTYREQGVLRRMSTTPVHPARLLAVQLLINLAAGVVSTTILIVSARLVFGAAMPRQWAWFVLVFLLGTAALLAIGLVIAALAPNGKAAPGIGSVVMFPLMFLGGMWVPREVMPDALRTVSDFSVAGPVAQALRDTWAGQAPQPLHLAVILGGLVLFGGLAARVFRWE